MRVKASFSRNDSIRVHRARNGTVSLCYEGTGTGAPVLLVMGLGMNATGWWRTVPVLAAAGLRVLTFDNRGVGRSDRPPGPYTTAVMADDAIAVLDATAVQRAHVYGISLGGMIAQEIALRHPDRIARLVLGATTPGGDGAIPADGETLEFFQRRGQMSAEEAVWASVPYNYSRRTRAQHGDRIVQDIRQRLRYPIEPGPYAAQLAAALGHDAYDRLARIRAPTLVVHGQEDVMVPPANGRLLANLIPDSAPARAARRSSSLSGRRTKRRPRDCGLPHRERRLSEHPEARQVARFGRPSQLRRGRAPTPTNAS